MSDRARILVVDDDAQIARLLQRRLEAEGMDVRVRHDGTDGLQQAVEWSPHLVIMDHYMPGPTGREVCRRMRELGMTMRVILCTTADEVGYRVAGLEAGADDYICKPFAEDELVARVRSQLRRAEPQTLPTNAAEELVERLLGSAGEGRSAAMAAIRQAGGGLRFQMLGDFRLEWRGVELSGRLWNRRKPREMLKLLLMEYDRRQPFEVLVDRLWPDADTDFGRRNLKVNAQRVRIGLEAFGAERLETVDGGYRFRLLPGDVLDLREFDRDLLEVERSLPEPAPAHALALAVNRMVEAYRGDLLVDEPYLEWVEAARTRCRAAFVDALIRGAAGLRQRGATSDACAALRRLLELDPTREDAAGELADLLLQAGDPAAADRVLTRTREALRQELGLEPGERLQAAADRLLSASD